MKKSVMTLGAALTLMSSLAHADICGIVPTAQGRTAANLIRAQIEQSPKKTALLYDDFERTTSEVKAAKVTNKNGSNIPGAKSKYFDFLVMKTNGETVNIDIGHTYLVINGGKTAISLEHLTGCGHGAQQDVLLEFPIGGPRAN